MSLVGPLLALVLAPLLVLLSALRLVAGLIAGLLWMMFGAPITGLNSLARRLGNPSYFNIAKYLLLIVGFVVLLLNRLST